MKITDNRTAKNQSVADIAVGEVFEYHETFYLKVEEIDTKDGLLNCISLTNYEIAYFSDHVTVHPVDAKMIIT